MTLPIEQVADYIVETVLANPVTIVVGETGSGKTTMIPYFLYKAGLSWSARIGVTQPRRLAAASVAQFLAKKLNVIFGTTVAYKVRFDDTTDPRTEIKFMTDGVLLRELNDDPLLSRYSVIMVDEAHERSANMDFLLGLLKQVLCKRPDFKLIIASATINAEKFSEYFDNAPVIMVEGRQHPVKTIWNDHDCSSPKEMIEEGVARVNDIHYKCQEGHILVFLPGVELINTFVERIKQGGCDTLVALPAHGTLTNEELEKIFHEYPGKRKVIVATNIAETSITIEGIGHVIDSGFIKQSEFYPRTGIEGIDVIEHSQAGCDQRRGRAGRTGPGTCYRLYTEASYKKRRQFTETEIRRMSLAGIALAMEALEIPDAKNFQFIEMPKRIAIDEAYKTLEALGAVEADKPGLTELGKEMSALPLEPCLSRMVLEARRYDCVEDVATIAAFLTQGHSIMLRPKGREADADAAHHRFKDHRSDMLTLLNIWKEFEETDDHELWCAENFFGVRGIEETNGIRNQLIRYLNQLGIKVASTNDPLVVMRSVAAGLVYNLLTHTSRHAYKGIVRKIEKVYIHPGSAVFSGLITHRWIVSADIFSTTKVFARHCSLVQPGWLPELAPERFSFSRPRLRGLSASKEDAWGVGAWVEYTNEKGIIVRAGEVSTGSVSLREAKKVQSECVDEAEANGWILLSIANDPDPLGVGMVGYADDGTLYHLVDTAMVSPEENDHWYCLVDRTLMPGQVYVRPQFPLFELPEEEVSAVSMDTPKRVSKRISARK